MAPQPGAWVIEATRFSDQPDEVFPSSMARGRGQITVLLRSSWHTYTVSVILRRSLFGILLPVKLFVNSDLAIFEDYDTDVVPRLNIIVSGLFVNKDVTIFEDYDTDVVPRLNIIVSGLFLNKDVSIFKDYSLFMKPRSIWFQNCVLP